MADEADRAQQDTEAYMAAIPRGYELPAGKAGECASCGEHSQRLIGNACTRCRDLLGLK